MNGILKVLQEDCSEVMEFFSEVYLFGSSLYETNPSDIDLLLVYEEESDFHIDDNKRSIFDLLMTATGIECHFVTLSKYEMNQTGFLNQVKHERIK